jgi:hypothetical protein
LGWVYLLTPKWCTPFMGLTFRYTMSPTWGSHVLLFKSA